MNDQELIALLPWYINDTLSADEKAAVESLLKRSEQAQQELVFLQQMSENVKSQPQPQPSELNWQRLKRDISKEPRNEPASAEKTQMHKAPLTRDWWKSGMAVAAALIVALQVGIYAQDHQIKRKTELLNQSAPVLQQPHWILQASFSPKASWQEIYAILNAVGARTVDGPSALGLMRLAVPKEHKQFASAEEVVSWMQQQAIIEHVAVEID